MLLTNEIYIILTLFFSSLLGIVFMLSKKVMLLEKHGLTEINHGMESLFGEINTEQLKNFLLEKIKQYGHLAILTTLRIYIKSTNFLKNKYALTKELVLSLLFKNTETQTGETKEINSKFLKVVMEYKQKIREMKDKIYQEENIL